jgi:tRNA(fMet)-specific endonuclease VapC
MNKALLDIDIYSEILRVVNTTVVANARSYPQTHGVFTLSVITVMEMVKGFQQVQRPQRIIDLLAYVAAEDLLAYVAAEDVLDFRQPAAELAGRIWGDLERTGQPIGLADPMIAAIALTHGLELATGNVAHYQRIQQLGYPLVLVNWRQ